MARRHDHLTWSEISRQQVYDATIFELVESRRRSADGREASFVFVDSPDWIHVIATVKNADGRDCFVMVRQFRQGALRLTLEFPGGLVDHGEEPEEAGFRELREETGYEAGRIEVIGSCNPNPAIMTNTVFTLLAHDCHPLAEQDLDTHEIVDAELVPVDDILADRHPEFSVHAIMLAGLHFYERRMRETH